jgi:hypothetical protein
MPANPLAMCLVLLCNPGNAGAIAFFIIVLLIGSIAHLSLRFAP